MTYYSVADIAERHGVSVRTVTKWITTGELKGICVSKNPRSKKPRYRVREVDLELFETGRMPTPPAPRAPRRKREQGIIEFYS